MSLQNMKTIKLNKRIKSLSTRVAVLVTLGGTLVLSALGFYFDQFLQHSFKDNAQSRVQHAFERLAFNISQVEFNLQEGISFIRNHEPTLASIALINNYEDKNTYNTFLLDEEKKALAEELLKRVKLSFNDTIALYNQNSELIAYVARDHQDYHLNFISYDNSQIQLMRRWEYQSEYQKTPLDKLEKDVMALRHQMFYDNKEVEEKILVTYQKREHALDMRSHMSIRLSPNQPQTAHIEMSRILDEDFFRQLSENLNVNLTLSQALTSGSLISGDLFPDSGSQGPSRPLRIQESSEAYHASLKIDSLDGPVYLTASLARGDIKQILEASQQQFLLLLLLAAVFSLLFIYLIIHRSLQRPLHALMEQIEHIEHRDYRHAKQLTTGDELETVSAKLNQLARSVQEREQDLVNSKAKLEYMSNHDVLTNLPNRRFFAHRLEYSLKQAQSKQTQLAVMFIDLDQFKQVNDTQGHHIGDLLLTQVAERLRSYVGRQDTLARIGGDEFNILIEDLTSCQQLAIIAQKYIQMFSEPFTVQGQEITISSSIGIALYPRDGTDSVDLIKNADLAMYQAKEQGRNNFCFFSDDLFEQLSEKTEMTYELRQAIQAGDQFVLHYQPKVCAGSGRVASMEALIRWISPKFGFVPPDKFISLAEESGMIHTIGKWVLEQGCHDYMRLQEHNITLEHVGINVSNIQLQNEPFIPELMRVMKESGIQAKQLELEITESYIATDADSAIKTLQTFRDMGLGIAIDDFGTGYSSMSYLQKLPISRLKIDKSFVDGLPHDSDSIAIVNAIMSLTENFKLEVTAEGVEYQEQLEFLAQAGCDEIQGYYFSKPLPFDQLVEFCQARNPGNLRAL